jgi:ferritin-like metal-binding protein YciE
MPMQTPMDLLMHELGDIYDEENRLLQILPALASEASNPQIQNAFQQHLRETQQQVQNLEQCFQALGQQPQRETCTAIQGLKQEHDSFVKENPSAQVLDMFDLGAGLKTEYYEMASYQGLIEKCRLMGQQNCAQLLQQNYLQEHAMAQEIIQLSQQLGQQIAGQMTQQGQMGTGYTTTAP